MLKFEPNGCQMKNSLTPARILLAAFFLAAPLAAGSSAAAEDPPAVETSVIMGDAVNGFIRPGYAAFAASGDEMVEAASQLCTAPGTGTLEAARQAFRDLVLSWSAVEIVRFGPVSSENRLERILFYPDRKSTGLRQIQAALASDAPGSWMLEDLQAKSVAMQGLGALEFSLFGDGAENLIDRAQGKTRCHYVELIAANLSQIGGELVAAWADRNGIAKVWTTPGPDNPVFREPLEALSELLGTMIHGLENIRDVRIGNFTGTANKKGFPRTAIYRRSEMTLPAIAANLASVRRLFDESGLERAAAYDTRRIGDQVRFELDQTARTAAGFEGDVESLLADPVARERLAYLRLAIRNAIERLDGQFSAAAGLSAGFSFGDGD